MQSGNNQEELFGKFRILDTIKQNKQSGVYIARHLFLEKQIFLKTINLDRLTDTVTTDRFKREARILAKFDHPNIIKVYDFGTWENYFYISFEYFEAEHLREFQKKRPLSYSEKRSLTAQLTSGLSYAHDNLIIHRDLKPENILVDNNLKLKIADFGLALVLNEPIITEASSIVGTPAYMSPEQIRGEALDQRSDLFSLGILLFELFSGNNPYLGKDTGSTLNNILTLDITSQIKSNKNISAEMQTVIQSLLTNDRNKRLHPATEIFKLLNLTEAPLISNNLSGKNKHRSSIYRIAISTALILVILAILVIGTRSREKNPVKTAVQLNENPAVVEDTSGKTEHSSGETLSHRDITIPKTPSSQTINVTNPSRTKVQAQPRAELINGWLNVECQPWAEVYLDTKYLDSTPFNQPLAVAAGEHVIKLKHPNYPDFTERIHLHPDQTLHLSVNLDTTIGYFNCRVFPWGEVFIDNKLIGQTPLKQPARISPGQHDLTIKNPGYMDYNRRITTKKGDTLYLEINLETTNGKGRQH